MKDGGECQRMSCQQKFVHGVRPHGKLVKFSSRLLELRREIAVQMTTLITSDYYLLEVPNHTNVGDYLIWQGEVDFLSSLPYKCLGTYSSATFNWGRINPDAVILMNGGGSFGDVWPESIKFKLDVVKRYPNNKIVFFPQSVQFLDYRLEQRALSVLSEHPNLIICVRDGWSYDYLLNAGLKAVLVPDMAFFIDVKWNRGANASFELLVLRNDCEAKNDSELERIRAGKELHVSDWPTIERRGFVTLLFETMMIVATKARLLLPLVNYIYNEFYRKYIIIRGYKFIGGCSFVHATRLHAGILALLMGKRVVLYDNSYGKISRFYETWLQSCDEVSLRG